MARRPRQKNRKLIADPRTKHTTFSKRRCSIFQKASELCTLCAVEMALVIFSPGGKPYSFGHPSTDAVIDRLITGSADPILRNSSEEEKAQREAIMAELDKEYSDLNAQLKEEKERGKELNQEMKNLPDIEKMSRDELMKLKESLEALRVKIRSRKEELLAGKGTGDDDDLRLTLGGVFSGGEASSSSSAKTDHHHQAGEEDFSANADDGDDGDLSLNLSPFVPGDA
ncbi:agamous-like MADS-box protein AGL29 [Neltuma alba]|uniref:agamous-like MADS-box protein AGL29 n=1 Tax=Neltuma alba TaxID=207710 RepID=UPI0010A45250|nr:agamous-like MADS-box protein AGL29 [Prosopis alba]